MPSSYTTSLRLTLPATGENSGTWGTLVNTGITELTDAAIAGYVSIAMTDADYTLTVANGLTDQARRMMLNMTGTLTAARNVICPTASKLYIIKNATTGGFAITLKTSAGTGISIPNGSSMLLMCNGTDVVDAITQFSNGAFTNLSYTGTLTGGTGVVNLGSGQFYKDASGNVGIGTASPGQKLTVAGGSALLDNAQYYYGKNAAGSAVRLLGINSGNVNYVGAIDSGPTEVNYGAATTITTQYWNIGAAEQMRLTSTGLGIGTSSPSVKLDVVGEVRANNLFRTTDGTNIGLFGSSVFAAGVVGVGSSNSVPLVFGTGATERMRLDASGNLGIGTASPGAKLDVVGAGVFRLDGSGSTTPLTLRNNNTASTQLVKLGFDSNGAIKASINAAVYGNDYMTFNVGSDTERMRLDASGNLGIGTISPQKKLVVSDAGAVGMEWSPTDNPGSMRQLAYNRSTSAYVPLRTEASQHEWYASSSEAMRLDSAGNLGLGVTPGYAYPGWKVIQCSRDATFGSVSGGPVYGFMAVNAYPDLTTDPTTATWGYRLTGSLASKYEQIAGVHRWFNAPSGTAGNPISFTQAMTLDASGNLGLGVTPSAWVSNRRVLQIGGGAAALALNGTGAVSEIFANAYRNTGGTYIYAATGHASYVDFNNSSTGGWSWSTAPSGTAGNAISFTQAMTLDASGNLGVGGVNPYAKVAAYVASSGTFQNAIGATNSANSDLTVRIKTSITDFYNSAGDFTFSTGGSGGTERARITSGGNLLVGSTTDTDSKIRAEGTEARIRSRNSTSGAEVYIGAMSPNEARLWASTSTDLTFGTNNTEKARITSGGNLLVGTQLEGVGIGFSSTIAAYSAAGYVQVLRGDTAANAITYYWNRAAAGDNQFVLFTTDTGAAQRGSIIYNRAGGLVAYNTTSDYRAKDIIGPVQNPGATIDALKVYEGQMKGATQSRPMLVAHEAQEHAPYAVSGEKDEVNEDGTPKFQQIDVSSLVPLLLAEIQSLRARVASLENQP